MNWNTWAGAGGGGSLEAGAPLAGSLIPSVNNTYDLGSSTYEWKDLYVVGTSNLGATNVAGNLDVQAGAWHSGGAQIYFDNIAIAFGNSQDAKLAWSTDQATSNALLWGLDAGGSMLILTDVTNFSKNHDHAAQSTPTLFIHSNTDPDSANDEWVSLTHNVTDPVLDWGSGYLDLAGTTAIASTVTHDEHLVIKIGGVTKKIMLGS